MAIAKPANHVDWVPAEGPTTQEPIAGKKLVGYVADDRPPAVEHNWIFARFGNWQKYFESVTDELVAGNSGFDAIVGSGPGTYATINDAIAAVSAGARIFVKTAQAVAVTQIVSKNDIELTFSPIAILSQVATLALGLQVTAERVRIIRPRFADWDNNVGDIPLQFTGASRNCLLDGAFFFNSANPTPLVDAGVNNTINNAIEEQ